MEHILPSGAQLNITVAPFADAHALLKAILRSVKGMSLPQNISEVDMSMAGIAGNPQLFGTVVDKILSVAVSDDVEKALFKCLERTTYDGVKIHPVIFDDPKYTDRIREDYYSICLKVIEANCKPFFKTAFSELLASTQTLTESPK